MKKNRPALFVRSTLALALLFVCGNNIRTAAQLASNAPKAVKTSGAVAATRRAQPRRLVPLRTSDTAAGSRVVISSDTPIDDYAAYRNGNRFFLLIPRAEAADLQSQLAGRGFTLAQVETKGEDVLLTFTLDEGATARVNQKFNRLEVLFTMQGQKQPPPAPQKPVEQAQSTTEQKPPAGQTTAPEPTASPAPATEAPANPPATVTNPTTSPSATNPTATNSATEAAKAVAGVPTNYAERVSALLTPEKREPVSIKRFEKPPVIDGKMDDDVWKSAAVFKDFVQNRPGDLIPPSKPTEAYIGYDAKFLYVAFRAFDEPDKVRATVPKRDAVFDDDWVGIFLDTFNDGRRAYELIFNPLGVQADAVFTEGVNEDFSVDIVMDSKGSITSDGYFVEVAIPFKSLRYVAGKDKHWGVHFFRVIKRFNNEQSSWIPLSRDNSSLLGQKGRITGLEGISTERTLEIIPSLTLSETGRRVNRPIPGDARVAAVPTDRLLNKPIEMDFGVSAKYTITPQITLDFTYNPDFAQVEADATVVTANQRFPIFFDEKRPFFLEGKEIFETLISAVHTRTIVDPQYAVKLTGKQGRNTFGLMMASDIAPGNLDDDERDFILATQNTQDPNDLAERNSLLKILDKKATIGVLRLKRDIGKENHIGLLATTYNFIDNYNHVGGLDARFRLNKTTTLTAQVLGSIAHKPFFYAEEAIRDDRKEMGMVYGVYLNSDGRNWGYEIGAVGRSRFFRADVGFNRRFNTNNPTLFIRYNSNDKPKNWMTKWRVYNFIASNFDWQGRQQRFVNESQVQLNFQKQSYLGLGFEKGYERVFEDEFGGTRGAFANINARTFGPALAATLPACDQTGTLGAPDPEGHPDAFLRQCTFFGEDNERSADRTTFYMFGGTVPSKKYSASFFTSYNHGVLDFDFGSGSPRYPRVSPAALQFGQGAPLDPGAGNEWYFESNLTYKPTNALNLSLFYVKDGLTRHDTGRTAYNDNIFTLRGTYQFTRFIFARSRIDYTTLGSRMRMQYLLGWAPNPGTSLYVGYNDDLNRNGFGPFTGELEPGFRRNGRLFFIKASYLIRRSF
ncbi:MAG TPA: DUF5916 domain-containing protein [Pyrinomonadaceae bacterium]|jgi:hypothetical protein|nr:DUF5916 domain-containing protein [Pyrinomonadaceae bacterium]